MRLGGLAGRQFSESASQRGHWAAVGGLFRCGAGGGVDAGYGVSGTDRGLGRFVRSQISKAGPGHRPHDTLVANRNLSIVRSVFCPLDVAEHFS